MTQPATVADPSYMRQLCLKAETASTNIVFAAGSTIAAYDMTLDDASVHARTIKSRLEAALRRAKDARGSVTSLIDSIAAALGVQSTAPTIVDEPIAAPEPHREAPSIAPPDVVVNMTKEAKFEIYLDVAGETTNAQTQQLMGLTSDEARALIDDLVKRGVLFKASSKIYRHTRLKEST